jgi:hypothetical protein
VISLLYFFVFEERKFSPLTLDFPFSPFIVMSAENFSEKEKKPATIENLRYFPVFQVVIELSEG